MKLRKSECKLTNCTEGLDKSAAEFSFTLSALDAKENDDACYSCAYVKGKDALAI